MKRLRERLLVTVLVLTGTLLPLTPASAEGATYTGSVKDQSGAPIAGASVVAMNAQSKAIATTDASGLFSLTMATPGTEAALMVSANSYKMTVDQEVPTGSTKNYTLERSSQKFSPLPVFGASGEDVVADAKSGVFYASTSGTPQVFRTDNYGGSWSAVNLALDNPETGLGQGRVVQVGTTSVEGEVFVALEDGIYVSDTFGNSWRRIPLPSDGTPAVPVYPEKIFWAHQGSVNKLYMQARPLNAEEIPGLESSVPAAMYEADPIAPTPVLQKLTGANSLVVSDRQTMAMGFSNAAPYFAHNVSDNPALNNLVTMYRVPDDWGGSPIAIINVGFNPDMIAIGKAAATDNAPMTVIAVDSQNNNIAIAAKSTSADNNFTVSAVTTVPNECNLRPAVNGKGLTVSPGTAGTGILENCWVSFNGESGANVTLTTVNGLSSGRDFAIDSGYDGSANSVIIGAQMDRGFIKIAEANSGVPVGPSGQGSQISAATAGTASTSGGISVEGITAPVVKDVKYGPNSMMSIALMMSGGGLSMYSADGGKTLKTAVYRGADSTAWLTDANGHNWLLYGSVDSNGSVISSFDMTANASPIAIASPNLVHDDNSPVTLSNLANGSGVGSNAGVNAIVPRNSTNTFLTGSAFDDAGGVAQVTIDPATGKATNVTKVGTTYPVRSIAYCPSNANAKVANKVFAATARDDTDPGNPQNLGELVSVVHNGTTLTGSAQSITLPAVEGSESQRVHAVAADCATGRLFVGTGWEVGAERHGALYVSDDGGATFANVTPDLGESEFGPRLFPAIRTIAVNPDSSGERYMVSAGEQGFLAETADNGKSWNIVNDPEQPGGFNFSTEGVTALSYKSTATSGASMASMASNTSSAQLVIGTGSGAYAISVDTAPATVPATRPTTDTPIVPPLPNGSYRMVGADGGVYGFGEATFHGSMGGQPLNQPVVGIANTPSGDGYWLVAKDGGIFAFGDATFYGSMGGQPLNEPIVGIVATASGNGYWMVGKDGGMFAFGDATFYGSMGGQPLNEPIVGMVSTASGNGYYMVAADGGVFAFGDATFRGSMGGKSLNSPIVSMSVSTTAGYYMVAADGGVFNFGDAKFSGSMGGENVNAPVVGIGG